jgi:hypothetical protein
MLENFVTVLVKFLDNRLRNAGRAIRFIGIEGYTTG